MPDLLQSGRAQGQPVATRYEQKGVRGGQWATGGESQPQSGSPAVVRGQAADDTLPSRPDTAGRSPIGLATPTRLEIPAPEQMGITSPASTPVAIKAADWSTARSRLDQMGAIYYRLEKAAPGTFRFSCALPHGPNGSTQRQFEAEGQSEQQAITLAMRQVEDWKRTQVSAPP